MSPSGQSLMAVRSLTEIWIDANFKETQLAELRIGQRVLCDVDMYGSRRQFEGRITGFTMGTGQTLALLPAQNATGNYVKIVQRLPVRIELTNYQPARCPLVRRPVGCPLRLLQRAAHRAARRGDLAAASPSPARVEATELQLILSQHVRWILRNRRQLLDRRNVLFAGLATSG